MPSLKEVRNRIKSVKSTQQITKAMKMVAASKLRRAQDNILQLRPFAEKLHNILENVVQTTEESITNEYTVTRDVQRILIIAISSDRGLCGAFNSNVFKKVRAIISEEYQYLYDNDQVDILPIGKKSYDFFRKRNYKIIDDYWELFSEISYEKVRDIAEFALQSFKKLNYDQVILVYNEFKNVATQILKAEQFLPIDHLVENNSLEITRDYIFEPTREYIIKELIPQLLHIQFY